jgi:Pyruvate/2-oxoacid:ferredoxin oxidoreductase gamma subunit
MDNEQISALYQIGGAASVIIVGAFFGIQWVVRTVQAMKSAPSVKTEKTTIITGDTVAMDRLSSTIEASNVILTENNVLRREEHADRADMREALEQNTKAVEQAKDQIIEARRDIKDLAFQMARAGK